ncbi:MAG TPA: hypothetical protein VGI41_08450, partial [Candidatus Udaeobacter sp.]
MRKRGRVFTKNKQFTSSSRKVQLILNGKVAGNDALRTAVARQRGVGHAIEVRVTSDKGDARR